MFLNWFGASSSASFLRVQVHWNGGVSWLLFSAMIRSQILVMRLSLELIRSVWQYVVVVSSSIWYLSLALIRGVWLDLCAFARKKWGASSMYVCTCCWFLLWFSGGRQRGVCTDVNTAIRHRGRGNSASCLYLLFYHFDHSRPDLFPQIDLVVSILLQIDLVAGIVFAFHCCTHPNCLSLYSSKLFWCLLQIVLGAGVYSWYKHHSISACKYQ